MVEIIPFEATPTAIEGLFIITMKQITDDRGTVREFYRESAFVDAGIESLGRFVQVNVTESAHGAIRGIHGEDMEKLVAIVAGTAFGAYVDLRKDSPTFGTVVTVDLVPGTQVLVPRGVGNGFQSTSPGGTQYCYCFTSEWVPGMAGVAVSPLDPDLAIRWPLDIDVDDPTQLSAKDAGLPRLHEI